MTDVDAAIEDLKGWETHYSPYEEMRDNAIAALEALRAENAKLIEAARNYDQVVVSCKTLGAITNEQRIHVKKLRHLICALLEDVDKFTDPITMVRGARIRELAYIEACMEVEEKRDD